MLLAADGESNTAIADKVGVSRPTVIGWRSRYRDKGIAGLDDDQRSGRPRMIDHRRVVSVTLAPPPKKFGVTHWSSRLLGQHLRVSNGTIATAWREYGMQPWRSETFKFSTDPELVAKVIAVVGLYLAPPETAMESTFATVRLRQRATKGLGSRAAGIAMAFKLIEPARARWRIVNATSPTANRGDDRTVACVGERFAMAMVADSRFARCALLD